MSQTHTVEAAHNEKLPANVMRFSIVAAIGGFLFGFDASVINGANTGFQKTLGLSDAQLGQTSAIALLGSAAGALGAGFISDSIGRVKSMLIASAMFFVSALGCGFAHSDTTLMIWRIIGGIGIGMASVLVPGYISEIAPAKYRGRLASFQQMAIVIGIVTVLFTNALFAAMAGGADQKWLGLEAWRWMFLLGVVPAVIYGVLAFRIPESPRYLLLKGDEQGAVNTLNQVNEGDTTETAAQVRQIEADIQNDSGNAGGLGAVLSNKVVWIGIALAAFQQFVGINVIFYYSTILWKSIGIGEQWAFWTSLLNGVINLVSTIWAIRQVDKLGRRTLLLYGAAGMAVTLGIMAIVFSMATMTPSADDPSKMEPHLSTAMGAIAVIAANLFVVSFAVSWGPVVWVLLGEMFPNKIRAVAIGIGGVANWLANYFISVTFPSWANKSLTFAYGFYAVAAVLAGLFVYFMVPETKGKELEDIDFDDPRGLKNLQHEGTTAGTLS
ncbi:MAG: sugar porter family MFS transporter [Micrococcaceae bacterium]